VPLVSITVDTEFPDQPAKDPLATLDQMLAMLSRQRAKATFFVVGSWARAHPDRVLALERQGHLIGNHSYAHCSLGRMTEAGITEDLTACHRVLADLGIETRPWFRAPYGDLSHDTVDVKRAIVSAGYKHVHWDARGEDWRPGRPAEEIARMTTEEVRRCWPRPAVVLFHSWPDPAPRALELTLAGLRSEGAKFVTLDQLGRAQMTIGRVRAAVGRAR
jgi:peptidoglycan/xylan/chitin deacetylase (PgdA/CDA1 family)